MVKGPSHRGRSLPISVLGPQQRPVPRLEHRVHPARVQLRLPLLLCSRQELADYQLQLAHPPGIECWRFARALYRDRQRQARMYATVDGGREAVAQGRGRVVDGENGEGQLPVPVVLAPVGEGAQRVA